MALWSGLIVVYGLLVAIGGIIGYRKAGSKVSLLSGLGSGVALAIAAYLTWQNLRIGLSVATIIAIALAIVFGMRWSKTGAWMPAGMMTILSGLIAIILISGLATAL
jgi:uncharacterized membrane protein (UPF0136 family)